MRTVFLKETSSTNDDIKQYLSEGENTVVCAERQTEGRGTKGRSFSSERGGVYLSFLRFYENFPASEAFAVMTHAAVSVCRTVEEFGISPEIKWCNDVLVKGKKIAGILIENILSGGFLRASIVGIGLNVTNPLNGLEDIAVSMGELLPSPPPAERVRDSLIAHLAQESGLSDYLHYIRFLNRPIRVTEGEHTFLAIAREILPDGRLLIEQNGICRPLSAAEISITF